MSALIMLLLLAGIAVVYWAIFFSFANPVKIVAMTILALVALVVIARVLVPGIM